MKDDHYLCMVTREGILKKTEVGEFVNAKKGGIIAINLRKGDDLVGVKVVDKGDDIVIATMDGHLLRTNLSKMRSMGRTAAGIIGIRLAKDNKVIGLDLVKKGSSLFVISENGFGKRVNYQSFITKGRGGKGMLYLKISDKNGNAAGIRSVSPEDEIIISSRSGMTIRLQAKDVTIQGRSTVGIKLIDIDSTDKVSDFAVIFE